MRWKCGLVRTAPAQVIHGACLLRHVLLFWKWNGDAPEVPRSSHFSGEERTNVPPEKRGSRLGLGYRLSGTTNCGCRVDWGRELGETAFGSVGTACASLFACDPPVGFWLAGDFSFTTMLHCTSAVVMSSSSSSAVKPDAKAPVAVINSRNTKRARRASFWSLVNISLGDVSSQYGDTSSRSCFTKVASSELKRH